MKKLFTILSVCVLLIVSCQKETSQPNQGPKRTVKFILYTNEDFSNITDTIIFTLHIKNTSGSIAFDSLLAGRRIKDIPGPSNKLVFEKTVPDDGSALVAGFLYEIKNVGYSWRLDSVAANEKFKVIEYPFQ
jgi:hypothetical protein